MIKKNITIPPKYSGKDIKHLSDYPILDNLLDQGKVILDKDIPGCGATEYYLRLPNRPVILTAPLTLLLESKMDMNPTDEELLSGVYDQNMKRPNQVHYFNRSDNSKDIEKTKDELYAYLQNKNGVQGFVPKIMATYDSFGIVCDLLKDSLQYYTIVVDEFPSIFQYVGLPGKGHTFLNFLERLNSLSNHVVYLTATPVDEKYLQRIPGFSNIPYYVLDWDPEKKQKVRINPMSIRSITDKMLEIVTTFRTEGHFRRTLDAHGNEIASKEGVFFLNHVSEIVKIINACRLTPNEVLILCARNKNNEDKLKKIDSTLGRFTIGKPANQWNYATLNKPFTFVTSVAFLGVDMHSDSSSTYVFANGNVPSLSLDIGIDLPQIAGRCRTNQPFKDDIDLFYVISDQKVIDKAKDAVRKRVYTTNNMLPSYSHMDNLIALRPILDAQEKLCYKEYYLDVQDLGNGKGKVVVNETAYQAHLRAIDIKEGQLRSGYTISRYVTHTAQPTLSNPIYASAYSFFLSYRELNDFVSRMKLYVDTLEITPGLKPYIEQILTGVDIEYKQFYNILGPQEIIRCGYRKADILRRINEINLTTASTSAIVARIYEVMPRGRKVSKKEVKSLLLQIYTEFGLKRNAKSTDLQDWGIPFKEIKIPQTNAKRLDGYEIM